MLKVLLLGFVGALVCTILTTGIGIIINRKKRDELNFRIGYGIASFIINFLWMVVFLYASCKEQTIFTVVRWMWPALIIDIVIHIFAIIWYEMLVYKYEFISTCVLAAISGIICFTSLFGPIQNLIFVHDMENVDITYAVKSDEILAKIELNIDNSAYGEDYYSVESPEMRKVNDEFIAVYHIVALGNYTEYIPGYVIQAKDGLPKIVSKRIYFDTSYCNQKDALRTIRRKYPNVILGDHKFDIDDNWNPYEVCQYRENLYSTNGEDYGLIILNLMNGTCEKYPAAENKIPSWVDFRTTYPR